MIKVHIWMPKTGKTVRKTVAGTFMMSLLTEEASGYGHASLEIPGRAYMSYWPPFETGKASGSTLSYAEDKDLCGGEADHTLTIYNLNENALLNYWQKERQKAFNAMWHNCCTISSRSIHVGFNMGIFKNPAHFAKIHWRAAIHPLKSFNVLTDDWSRLVTYNEPASLLSLAQYYKILTDE